MRAFWRVEAIISVLLSLLPSLAMAAPRPIRINIDAPVLTLEPPILTETVANWILHHIGDRLIEENHLGQLQGNLASKWKISSDMKTYEFEIAGNRQFEDGTPVTAEAAATSFENARRYRAKSRVGSYLDNIASVTAEKGGLLKIRLKKPSSNFLQVLSDASFTICKSCAKRMNICFTSSSFVLEKISSESIEFKRKADDQIFQLMPMTFHSAEMRFRGGDLEILRNYGIENLSTLSEISAQKSEMIDERSYFLAFNVTSERFKNRASREQVLRYLDFNALGSALKNYGVTLSHALLSPSLFLQKSDEAISQSEKRAGPAPRPFEVIAIESHRLKKFAVPLLSPANGHINEMTRKAFFERVKSGRFDALLIGYGITVRDWDYLSTLFHSASSHNFAKIKDRHLDSLLVEARAAKQPRTRIAMYSDILDKNRQLVGYVPLFHVPLNFAYAGTLDPGFATQRDQVTTPFISLVKVKWRSN
jgi:ABC-type oligopeptide transport system substrate-binding subunit